VDWTVELEKEGSSVQRSSIGQGPETGRRSDFEKLKKACVAS
jgi:hypothetical protein